VCPLSAGRGPARNGERHLKAVEPACLIVLDMCDNVALLLLVFLLCLSLYM